MNKKLIDNKLLLLEFGDIQVAYLFKMGKKDEANKLQEYLVQANPLDYDSEKLKLLISTAKGLILENKFLNSMGRYKESEVKRVLIGNLDLKEALNG